VDQTTIATRGRLADFRSFDLLNGTMFAADLPALPVVLEGHAIERDASFPLVCQFTSKDTPSAPVRVEASLDEGRVLCAADWLRAGSHQVAITADGVNWW